MGEIRRLYPRYHPDRVWRRDGYFDALSPIQHGGDEKTGSTPVLRALTHWDPEAEPRAPGAPGPGAHVRLPFISGNAIRGVLRRLVMRDLVERVGFRVRAPKLHHALYSGGNLESSDEASGAIDLAFRQWVREVLPPLALFGTALGNQMVPGCLIVSHARPFCREYRAYLGDYADDPRAQHSVRTFTDVAFASRRDDLRAERGADEQAQQMLVEFEAFVPGTRFLHSFVLKYANPLERACLDHALLLWAEQPWIGGKSGSGYGEVALYYPPPAPELYEEYLTRERTRVAEALAALEERLGGAPAAAAPPAAAEPAA